VSHVHYIGEGGHPSKADSTTTVVEREYGFEPSIRTHYAWCRLLTTASVSVTPILLSSETIGRIARLSGHELSFNSVTGRRGSQAMTGFEPTTAYRARISWGNIFRADESNRYTNGYVLQKNRDVTVKVAASYGLGRRLFLYFQVIRQTFRALRSVRRLCRLEGGTALLTLVRPPGNSLMSEGQHGLELLNDTHTLTAPTQGFRTVKSPVEFFAVP
jgi:hypothetical protein